MLKTAYFWMRFKSFLVIQSSSFSFVPPEVKKQLCFSRPTRSRCGAYKLKKERKTVSPHKCCLRETATADVCTRSIQTVVLKNGSPPSPAHLSFTVPREKRPQHVDAVAILFEVIFETQPGSLNSIIDERRQREFEPAMEFLKGQWNTSPISPALVVSSESASNNYRKTLILGMMITVVLELFLFFFFFK